MPLFFIFFLVAAPTPGTGKGCGSAVVIFLGRYFSRVLRRFVHGLGRSFLRSIIVTIELGPSLFIFITFIYYILFYI
jgi:hypothetical protein